MRSKTAHELCSKSANNTSRDGVIGWLERRNTRNTIHSGPMALVLAFISVRSVLAAMLD